MFKMFPPCYGTVVHESKNHIILYDIGRKRCFYQPKPGSGCRSGCFGDLTHCKNLLRQGYWKPDELTPVGKYLLS